MDEANARATLAVLAQATGRVALGPFGAAAEVPPELRAYRDLSGQQAWLRANRAELEAMTRDGAGARRIYVALLLREIDGDAGRKALEAMLGSEEPCDFFPGGCVMMSRSLGGTAAFLLGRVVDMAPSAGAPGRVEPPRRERGSGLLEVLQRWLGRL